MKELVRIANTDIKGEKQLYIGLSRIKGVSYGFARAVCHVTEIERSTKVGLLSETQIQQIEHTIKNPDKIPSFLKNRQKDIDSGVHKHVSGVDLKMTLEFDLRRLKKMKSYKGLRHAWNLPVRGQRTRGNFRRGRAVGVMKKVVKQQSSKGGKGGKKK